MNVSVGTFFFLVLLLNHTFAMAIGLRQSPVPLYVVDLQVQATIGGSTYEVEIEGVAAEPEDKPMFSDDQVSLYLSLPIFLIQHVCFRTTLVLKHFHTDLGNPFPLPLRSFASWQRKIRH